MLPPDCDNLCEIPFANLDIPVRDVEVLADSSSKDASSLSGLSCAQRGCSSRAEFSARQIQDAYTATVLHELSNGAAAGQLNVVWMGTDGEDVEIH